MIKLFNKKVKKVKQKFDGVKFIKKTVIFCIIFITLYTIVAIVFQALTGDALSDTLTDRVYTCLISELAITGILKISENVLEKVKKDDNEDDEEDSEEETYVDTFESSDDE